MLNYIQNISYRRQKKTLSNSPLPFVTSVANCYLQKERFVYLSVCAYMYGYIVYVGVYTQMFVWIFVCCVCASCVCMCVVKMVKVWDIQHVKWINYPLESGIFYVHSVQIPNLCYNSLYHSFSLDLLACSPYLHPISHYLWF